MNATAAVVVELREGLPGHWNHQPNFGPVWWGVAEERANLFAVTEYNDRLPLVLAETVRVGSLSAAQDWIRLRKTALGMEV